MKGIFLTFFCLCFAGLMAFGADQQKEVKLDGTVLKRPDGSLVQVVLKHNNFEVRFWTANKKPLPLPYKRAVVFYDPVYWHRLSLVLTPSEDGKMLTNGKFVRPPHVFLVILNFFQGDSTKAAETYSFHYSGK